MKTDMKVEPIKTFDEFYRWLKENSTKENEVFVEVSRKRTENYSDILSYCDGVKAALCFGWIDSTLRNINGKLIQRFSPRKMKSHWTKTNLDRCLELDKLGLLQEEGKQVCPLFLKKKENKL